MSDVLILAAGLAAGGACGYLAGRLDGFKRGFDCAQWQSAQAGKAVTPPVALQVSGAMSARTPEAFANPESDCRHSSPRDCKHGKLARSCDICELEQEVAAQAAEIHQLKTQGGMAVCGRTEAA